MIEYLCIIQARLGSTRFPNKVMETVEGIPMVKRVWLAAKLASSIIGTAKMQVVVAWPERYPDLDQNNVLERFRRLVKEFNAKKVIRLTADCPLIQAGDILDAINTFSKKSNTRYFNNRHDGSDVQIFESWLLFAPEMSNLTDQEHVIKDKPNVGGLSVNTKSDLKYIRSLVNGK